MKVCPVCQYEEEQDSETSCAICGSDLDTEESPQPEDSIAEVPTTQPEQSVAETPETKVSDDEKADSSAPDTGVSDSDPDDDAELTDEEKLLEKLLQQQK